jgi:hypothetical protein
MNVLDKLVLRLKAINIEIELIGNYPWVYLYKVNDNAIKKEDYYLANHGFTVSFMLMPEREKMEITDIKKTFELIRKYR